MAGEHTGEKVNQGMQAVIHAKASMGDSISRIAKSVPYCYNTVSAVLKKQKPDKLLVEAIVKREMAELVVAGGLARNNIIRRLAEGQGNIIENTAVMDKTFQQRQLIANKPTEIHLVGVVTDLAKEMATHKRELSDKLIDLEASLID